MAKKPGPKGSSRYSKAFLDKRWNKGQSGNPAGRPKKAAKDTVHSAAAASLNRASEIIQRLSFQTIRVRRGNRTVRLPRFEVLIERTYQDAIAGKRGANRDLVALLAPMEEARAVALMARILAATKAQEEGYKALDDAARAGEPPPLLDPHPDHIDFDRKTFEPSIKGPMSAQTRRAQETLRGAAGEIFADYATVAPQLENAPHDVGLIEEEEVLRDVIDWLVMDAEERWMQQESDALRAQVVAKIAHPEPKKPRKKRKSSPCTPSTSDTESEEADPLPPKSENDHDPE